MYSTNQEVVELLRSVATALSLKKANIFQVRAYENAADAIEHSTSDIKDLWEEGKLGDIPGVGPNLQTHLEELFKTGKVKHFESIKEEFPKSVYELIKVPGVGPKTALDLARIGIKGIEDLKEKLKAGKLDTDLSEKLVVKLGQGLDELFGRTGRMLLPFAGEQAKKILEYLKKGPGVKAADPLGSLRRQVATIGDLDFAASAEDPEKVVEYFIKMPGVKDVLGKGENKATLVLKSGIHVDLLVGKPESYGALLQHFTGSKHHNIKLRTYGEKKGYSLSEYGVTRIKDSQSRIKGETISCRTEEELYKLLGMDMPAPEIREDSGEIEAALKHQLPSLVEVGDIKGDLHLHSNFPIEHPSHGPGLNPIEDIVEEAIKLGYEYVGISDHPPAHRSESKENTILWVEKRTKVIHKIKQVMPAGRQGKKSIHVLNGLEIDILPDGSLSVPDEALETLDYCIAGIHSSHRGSSEDITKRLIAALESPYVDIISHPTGRLIDERGSYDADWERVFKVAAKNKKVLEVNAFPNRLDLRDDLVRMAISFGCKFVVNTDAHEVSQMVNMPYGISVARRGWAEEKDIVNAWDWKKFSEWFKINQ